jgi:hypothetical protein
MERPFASEWATGSAAAILTAAVAMTAWGFVSGNILNGGVLDAVFEIVHLSVVLFGPGAVLGSALGVAVARRYGAFRPWRGGWMFGCLVGAVSMYVLVSGLGALFSSAT